jgi:hypothetical protein
MDFTAPIFVKFTVTQLRFMDISYSGFYRNRKKILGNADEVVFKHFSKVWVSLHRFSRNSQVHSETTWRSSLRNFTKIVPKTWKVGVENHLPRWVKYVSADFHENHNCPITFVKDSDSEFHKTPTVYLTAGTTSHTNTQSGSRVWSHCNFALNFVKPKIKFTNAAHTDSHK